MPEHWTKFAIENIEAWYADLEKHVEDTTDFAFRLLTASARLGFKTQETKLDLFYKGQAAGFHFMPVHFYNPMPDSSKIPESTWDLRYDHIPGIAIEGSHATAVLKDLAQFGHELADVPEVGDGYHWANGTFLGGDASLLYGMIRKHRPKRVLEIGSGMSTQIGLKALSKNGSGHYICVEPYPNPTIQALADGGQIELLPQFVQTVPMERFEELEKGDILFIDSTHVAQIGTDVTYEILQVLPRLKQGVIVHVHDIFLPYELARSWVMDKLVFWNEQHILAAFLAYNSDFEPIISNSQVARSEELRKAAAASSPHAPVQGGGSFWFRRKGPEKAKKAK